VSAEEREGTTVPQAAAVMAAARVHRVLVVSAAGKVVGVLSAMDVVRWVAREACDAV
jgi:CBS domain-containing protein